MDDLAAFLAARLDEDEAIAQRNIGAGPGWQHGLGDTGNGLTGWPDYQTFADDDLAAANEYLDRFRPLRVLREVEAWRKILALHHMDSDDYVDGDGIERAAFICHECDNFGSSDNWPCRTLRLLAAVWSDHPDYRQEWKP